MSLCSPLRQVPIMMKRTARLSLNQEGKNKSIAKFATMITICLHLSLILLVVIVSARKASEIF